MRPFSFILLQLYLTKFDLPRYLDRIFGDSCCSIISGAMKSFSIVTQSSSTYRRRSLVSLPWRVSIPVALIVLVSICHTSISVNGLSSPNGSPPSKPPKSNYYSYKTFKKLGLPALAYSAFSKAAVYLLRVRPKEIPISTGEEISLNGNRRPRRRRVAIVTGSNTGVGFETAKSLVQDHGFEVIIACRSMEKGIQACQAINGNVNVNGGMAIFVQSVDLADTESVRKFANAVNQQYETIDVLVNNAGRNSAGVPPIDSTTEATSSQSLDIIFKTNFLGHFLLTNLLLEKCHRIVNLASVMHHFPKYAKGDNDDIGSVEYWRNVALEPTLNGEETTVRKTYGPSKLAALLFSIELNRRYSESRGIRSIAVNPGAVNSDIWRNYPSAIRYVYRLLYLTAEQGSSTSVAASVVDFDPKTIYLQPYLLPSVKRKRVSPPFPVFEMLGPYAGFVETIPRLPEDGGKQACESLFAVCEELTGCSFEQIPARNAG